MLTRGGRDHQATGTMDASPAVDYDVYTLKTRLAAAKVLKKYEEWKWAEDLQISLSRKPWDIHRDLKIAPSLILILPITERSKKFTLLNEGFGGAVAVGWDLGGWVKGLSLTAKQGATYYGYEIPVAFDGKSNEQWRLSSRLVAGYEISKKFSVEILFGRLWAWSVLGTRFDRFEMDESLSFDPTANMGLSIGHNRGGNVLRSDGNNNLALGDARDSNFYFSLNLTI